MITWNSKGLSDEQIIEALKAVESGSTLKEQSGLLGCDTSNLIRRRDKLIRRGIWKPSRDSIRLIPEPYAVKRRSQMLDADGNLKLEWLISEPDKEKQLELMIQSITKFADSLPARPPVLQFKSGEDDLCNQFNFSDYHVGAWAWSGEGGSDWNLKIAADMGKAAICDMIERSPKAKHAIINNLGDWAHYDSLYNITPTSGHIVASHGSPEQMIDVALELLDFMIQKTLETHESVKVVIAQGNHDLYGAVLFRRAFTRIYRDEPRIEIINNAIPYYATVFGTTLLGYHHGHKGKVEQLPSIFANEFRKMIGETDRTIIHTGHQHHKQVREFGKTVVEMHRTLSSRDSHASYGGYHSERATDAITYHKKYGEIGRITTTPAMLGY